MQTSAYQLKPGTPAPDFRELPGVDGKKYSLFTFQDRKALVVFWHCNHCPYAQAFEDRMNQVCKDYMPRGVGFIAVNSNDPVEYPEDSFDNMKKHAREKGLAFPYVFDAEQAVAEAYGAQCTPHVFVFDGRRQLAYQGRVDGEQHDPKKGKAQDIRNAIEAVLAGDKPATPETRAFGCGIKWRKEHFARLRTV